MSKAYRRKDPFYAIVAKNRPTYDVFSDGTKSFDSNSSDSVPTDTNVNNKPKKPTNKRGNRKTQALSDLSNVSKVTAGGKRLNKASKAILAENIPCFDSFDDYNLVVQPVTPAKNHISVSTSTDDCWNVPTQEWLTTLEGNSVDSLATSSPKHGAANFSEINNSPAGNNPSFCNNGIPLETRRAKRLRQRLGDSFGSINTSTPEQVNRKAMRLKSPELKTNISHISSLDLEEDLVSSIQNISLNDPRDHIESSDHQKSPSESDMHCHVPSNSVGSSQGMNSIELSHHSVSLFSSSFSRNNASQLDSILEEEGSEPECAESPPSIYHTGEEHPVVVLHRITPDGSELSKSYLQSLGQEFKQFQSPSLTDLSYKRRERSVLRECLQRTFISWGDYMDDEKMTSLVKIGEGVYGEVFKYEAEDGDVSIIKVVPMEGDCRVNDEPQKRFHEMKKEILVTKTLSELGYNFVTTKRVVCTQGKYPEILLNKWDDYATHKVSENDRPDYFSTDQHYTVFEFSDGGEPLESYKFGSAAEGLSCLLQTGWTLAVAEDAHQFEHRDLHWSNILISSQDNPPSQEYQFRSCGSKYSISTASIKVNIIDFTLSRMLKGEDVIFCDLSEDETLFQGYGDYQFDVYRQMKAATGNNWRMFHSVTNVYWMKYLADKILKTKTFPGKRGSKPSVTTFKKDLMNFCDRCSDYYSAIQMVLTDPLFTEYSTQHQSP